MCQREVLCSCISKFRVIRLLESFLARLVMLNGLTKMLARMSSQSWTQTCSSAATMDNTPLIKTINMFLTDLWMISIRSMRLRNLNGQPILTTIGPQTTTHLSKFQMKRRSLQDVVLWALERQKWWLSRLEYQFKFRPAIRYMLTSKLPHLWHGTNQIWWHLLYKVVWWDWHYQL